MLLGLKNCISIQLKQVNINRECNELFPYMRILLTKKKTNSDFKEHREGIL